jgi:tetratricopeptide (TPR) repeat protein
LADLAALAADLEADEDLALDRSLTDLSIEAVASAIDDPEDLPDQPALVADPALDSDLEATTAIRDELMDLDELDDIDLGDNLPLEGAADLGEDAATLGAGLDYDPDATSTADAETLGAMQFADGEFAIAEARWDQAIVHLEAAYEHGVDVAELHTYLAWARFQASGESPEMADHALELLAYAEDMNPNLAVVFSYRSAVLLSLADNAGAQDAAQQALDIDPYDELAIDVMDRLV